MNCELRITLKSDMCSASGDGFSLSIDTDVSYDSHGLPVIPSRRIKGCMLESAKYIGAQNIGGIFGVSGTSRGSLRIGNAVPRAMLPSARRLKIPGRTHSRYSRCSLL